MRAFVLRGPGDGVVQAVPEPVAGPGEVVVEVERAGVCGTDVEFFTGEMAYLRDGHARYPMRLGHEWCGVVRTLGAGVAPGWAGRRVTGDTMLGCGSCRRCRRGLAHVCAAREEVGIRGGRPGALAERLAVPAASLHPLPDAVDPVLGALVEPGANALRAARAALGGAGERRAERILVVGPGTIGLLAARFAAAEGAEVHALAATAGSREFAASLDGLAGAWTEASLPAGPWDAVIDATDDPSVAGFAVTHVEPGGRIVLIGLAGEPTLLDTRSLVLGDVTAIGILSGSPGLADTITAYAQGTVDPRPLLAATVGLDGVAAVLAGRRPADAGPGPKIHVDPRRAPAPASPSRPTRSG